MTTTIATETAVRAFGLRFGYGSTRVLDGIDLSVPRGSVIALLGPNGAGKTTTVRLLTTLLHPDGGRAEVLGHDVVREASAVRALIGVTGQFSAVDELLTGRENLAMMADLHHLPRAERRAKPAELLARFELTDAADRAAGTYSGGMKRRLDLAMTLVGSPAVIFLDEPTTGLDPRSRRTMWDGVRRLVDDGVTILLTTQYLEEADALADRVVVLDHGRIAAEGTPAELKRTLGGETVSLHFAGEHALRAAAELLPAGRSDAEQLTLTVPGDGSFGGLRDLFGELERAGIEPEHLETHAPDLDDVFLAVTGRPVPADTPKGSPR